MKRYLLYDKDSGEFIRFIDNLWIRTTDDIVQAIFFKDTKTANTLKEYIELEKPNDFDLTVKEIILKGVE